ncbi:MAG TPA: peptidoglycan DD-metalloendopeptidase family protein [Pseudolabrys sp.]|nr:peptidoglycan DD-metalloendopeptidase family protein [Pseudolabrys sp.]
MAISGAAHAQQQPVQTQNGSSGKRDALTERQQELEKLRKQQSKSAESEAAIKREIEEIGTDRRKLTQSLIDAAARSRELEDKVATTEQRLQPLDSREADIRRSLEGRRAVIAEVLAALQRVGLQQPPALIASPEDALRAVRTAMMLGAVLPEMQHKVQALADDLNELFSVRKKIAAEHERLKTEMASLGDERARLTALIAERQKGQAERERALDVERAKARELAEKADGLQDLIAKLEQDLTPERHKAGEEAKPGAALAALHDPGRMAPAVAFANLHGKIPIPVNGIKVKDYGSPDGVGGSEKGVSIATRVGAQVTAPADGWVVYAGPFRSYGQLLILNAGGGYHILLAGMARISVDLGQFVLAGEPVAVMGNNSQIATLLAAGSSQPVLYVEFRKDGNPVDPGPWWAAGEGEKVRG